MLCNIQQRSNLDELQTIQDEPTEGQRSQVPHHNCNNKYLLHLCNVYMMIHNSQSCHDQYRNPVHTAKDNSCSRAVCIVIPVPTSVDA